MIYFVLWISVGGAGGNLWFVGPDYRERAKCEAAAEKIRSTSTGIEVFCGPRGMP